MVIVVGQYPDHCSCPDLHLLARRLPLVPKFVLSAPIHSTSWQLVMEPPQRMALEVELSSSLFSSSRPPHLSDVQALVYGLELIAHLRTPIELCRTPLKSSSGARCGLSRQS